MSWGFDEDHRELCIASLDDPIGRCLGIKIHYWGGLSPDGYLVYSRSDTLFAQAFDIGALRPIGEPVIVAEQISHDAMGRTPLSIADGGALVYETARPEVRQLVWVDRGGKRLGVVSEPGTYEGFDVSSDGKQVVAERTEPDGTGLWLIDVARGVSTKAVLTPIGAGQSSFNRVFAPVFSGDGQHFFYQTRRGGRAVIVEQPTRGGADRVVHEYSGEGVLYLADVSADGQWLAIGLAETGQRYGAVLPLSGGKPIVFAEGASVGLPMMRLSTDGRWVAYHSAETGRVEVYVSPLPPTGEKWRVSTAGGWQPQWRSDGLELFYLSLDGSLMATPIRGGKTFDAGTPGPLFATTSLQSRFNAKRYAVAADGQRFLLNVLREGDNAAKTSTLQLVLNWTAALKK
jgi:eukaryotic-like serine/threonine-protein kinase